MTFHIMTLFPEMIDAMRTSIIGRAIENGIVGLRTYQIRDFSADAKHHKTDDYTYGGGAGMLMQAQPIFDCYLHVLRAIEEETKKRAVENEKQNIKNSTEDGIEQETKKQTEDDEKQNTENHAEDGIKQDTKNRIENDEKQSTENRAESDEKQSTKNRLNIVGNTSSPAASSARCPRLIYVTPQGKPFTQKMARTYAKSDDLILLCGHYEGVDERVLEETGAERVSIGDYVLTGGELPAMVLVDAVARLVPGVLSNEESAQTESFDDGLLEYPQYSRPEIWNGRRVPEILLSGDHAKVDAWRHAQSLACTREVRPDLYEAYLKKNPGQEP